MYRKFSLGFLFFCGALLAQELIVNTDFAPANVQKTEAMGWTVVKNAVKPGNTPCVFGEGMAKMTLFEGEKGVTLLQKNPPLAAGKTYTVSFEAKGTAPQLNCYFEWIYADKKWGNSGTTHIKIGKEWGRHAFKFTMPTGKAYRARPYLAIGLRVPGTCSLRKVSIKEAEPQLLVNPEFTAANASGTAASGWRVIPRGIKKGNIPCLFADNMAKLTVSAGEKGVILVQRQIPFEQGESYKISFEVKGDGRAALRTYLEWIFADGKWGNTPTRITKTADKWQNIVIDFTMPGPGKEFKSTPYLAFSLNGPGECFVRKVSDSPQKKKNEIKDPGFDNAAATPWKLEKNASIDRQGGRKTPGVLCLNGPGARASLVLRLEGGRNYRIGYHVRGMDNPNSANGFSEYKAEMKLARSGRIFGSAMQDCFQRHWQSRSETIRVPEGKPETLSIVLTSLSDGKIQFDDFSMEEVELAPEKMFRAVLRSPYYRNAFFSSRPEEKEIRGEVSAPADMSAFTVSFGDRTLSFRNTGKAEQFVFPAEKLKPGKYDITFSGKLENGRTVVEKTVIEKLAPAKNEVTVGSDKRLYVNGGPYMHRGGGSGRFPMVLWPYGMHDVADYYLSRTGMGCTFPMYMDGIKPFLDECQKKGIKAVCRIEMVGTWLKLKDEEKFRKYWQGELEKIAAFKDHPALLAYYPYDEPLWNGIPLKIMKYTYESLRTLDPYHPVINVEAPRGLPTDWKPYARYCDIFSVDIYPVPAGKHSGLPEKGMRSVGEYTKLCMETMRDHGMVSMSLQAFSWGNSKPALRRELPYPTREEFRFMIYDALLHGARSLGFYMHKNYDPVFEKTFYEVMCELNGISSVMLKGKKVEKSYPASKGIMAMTVDDGKEQWIIVLNRADTAGHIDLQMRGRKLFLHNGEQSIPVPDCRIADIAPLTARVYGTSPALPLPRRAARNEAMEKRLPEYFRRLTSLVTGLDTGAWWIWSRGKSDICCAARTVEVTEKPRSARIKITADDSFTLYLNGNVVLAGGFWQQYHEADLARLLKQGRNVLAVYAANRGGAAGLLVDLELVFADGTRKRILSDKSWLTTGEVPSYNWLTSGIGKEGKPAKELFPFGKGPWAR